MRKAKKAKSLQRGWITGAIIISKTDNDPTPPAMKATGVGGGFAALGKNDASAQRSDTVAVTTTSQGSAKKATGSRKTAKAKTRKRRS
jgi:hypothetical protein